MQNLYAPSTDDVLHLVQHDYLDFSICISSKEIWVIEHKGKFTLPKSRQIEREILPIEEKARLMKDNHTIDEINMWYGAEIEKSINGKLNKILSVYRVIL